MLSSFFFPQKENIEIGNFRLHLAVACLDFLKVVRLVFWSKARLVSKSIACPNTHYRYTVCVSSIVRCFALEYITSLSTVFQSVQSPLRR